MECSSLVVTSGFAGVAFVGGFSYGDVLDSAKGWAAKATFNTRCRDQLQKFYDEEVGVTRGLRYLTFFCRSVHLLPRGLQWLSADESAGMGARQNRQRPAA